MKTTAHISTTAIKRNQSVRPGDPLQPVIVAMRQKVTRRGNHLRILNAAGECMAEIKYQPEAPAVHGARVWLETDLTVEVDGKRIGENE